LESLKGINFVYNNSSVHGPEQPHAVTQASPPPFLQQVSLHYALQSNGINNSSVHGPEQPHAVTQASPPPFLQQVSLH